MKDVHNRAEPFLLRLAVGDWWPLSRSEQEAVAAYFTLLTMTWEFADRLTMATTQEQRRQFMGARHPPANWWVYIGEYAGGEWDEMLFHRGFVLHDLDLASLPKTANSQFTVSTFGKLVFSTLSIGETASEASKIQSPVDFGRYLRLQTIWPPTDNIRKPSRPLSDAEVNRVRRVFAL